jgi:hypothetical protein
MRMLNSMEKNEKKPVRWNHYVSYFFGGSFLSNGIPHVVMGITGHSFPSPIATLSREAVSSAMINVLWGVFNLAMGYFLICSVGTFEIRRTRHVLVAGARALLRALFSAYAFSQYQGGY